MKFTRTKINLIALLILISYYVIAYLLWHNLGNLIAYIVASPILFTIALTQHMNDVFATLILLFEAFLFWLIIRFVIKKLVKSING